MNVTEAYRKLWEAVCWLYKRDTHWLPEDMERLFTAFRTIPSPAEGGVMAGGPDYARGYNAGTEDMKNGILAEVERRMAELRAAHSSLPDSVGDSTLCMLLGRIYTLEDLHDWLKGEK